MFLLVVLAACSSELPADRLLDGPIRVGPGELTDALAIRDGVVVAHGDAARRLAGPATEVVPLDGVAHPGFHDAHVHLLAGSFVLDRLLVRSATSMDRLVDAVADYAEEAPDEPWIVGYGWSETIVDDADGRLLDAVAPDRPVLLVAGSGHSAIVNGEALRLAGITASTPDPLGGRIVRDPDTGAATGLLLENALSLVVPSALEAYDDDALRPALERRLDELSRGGLTAVSEILAAPGVDLSRPWLYTDLEAEGRLPLRIHYYVPVFAVEDLAAIDAVVLEDTERVRFAGAKLWIDGSISALQGWTTAPYDSTGEHGSRYFDPEELVAIVEQAEARGISLKMHAMGDAAVDAALDALEAVADESGLSQAHVIEHAVVLDDSLRARIAALDVVVSAQPSLLPLYQFSSWPAELGIDDLAEVYDLPALREEGITVALGTDWPVWPQAGAPVNLWVAATSAGLTAEDAFRGYTEAPARTVGLQGEQGCLDVGCAADWVVLDLDLLDSDPQTWGAAEVLATGVAGRGVGM